MRQSSISVGFPVVQMRLWFCYTRKQSNLHTLTHKHTEIRVARNTLRFVCVIVVVCAWARQKRGKKHVAHSHTRTHAVAMNMRASRETCLCVCVGVRDCLLDAHICVINGSRLHMLMCSYACTFVVYISVTQYAHTQRLAIKTSRFPICAVFCSVLNSFCDC